MVKIIKRGQTRFRIQIYDLKEHKSRGMSLADEKGMDVDKLKEKIEKSLTSG